MVRAAISVFQNTSALRRSRATVAFWIESPAITAMPVAGRHRDRDRPGRVPGRLDDLHPRQQPGALPGDPDPVLVPGDDRVDPFRAREVVAVRAAHVPPFVRVHHHLGPREDVEVLDVIPVRVRADHDVDAVPGQAPLAQGGVQDRPPAGMARVDHDPPEHPVIVQPLDEGDRAEGDGALVGTEPVTVEQGLHVRAAQSHGIPSWSSARARQAGASQQTKPPASGPGWLAPSAAAARVGSGCARMRRQRQRQRQGSGSRGSGIISLNAADRGAGTAGPAGLAAPAGGRGAGRGSG